MNESIQQFGAGDALRTRAGRDVVIRPIRGGDEDGLIRFHLTLSPETVYTRYFNVFKLSRRITHERLDRVCHPAPGEETVLVVEAANVAAPGRQIVGVGRLSRAGVDTGEVAVVVADAYQRQGIGSELLHRLLRAANERKLCRVRAHILRTNVAMRQLCVNAGMQIVGGANEPELRAEVELRGGRRENAATT